MMSYFNPFVRFFLLSELWATVSRIQLKIERENPGASPLKISIFTDYLTGWLRHGFSMKQYEDYEIYRVRNCVRRNIVTNRRALKLEALYNEDSKRKQVEDKTIFNSILSEYVQRRWVNAETMTRKEFDEFISGLDEFMAKPKDGDRGIGIKRCRVRCDSDRDTLYETYSGRPFILEEFIEQHPAIAFGRSSVNTIRMYTLLDKGGKAHHLKSVLRIGALGKDVDNYHCGGSIWPLDKENGFIECPGKTLTVTDPIFYLLPNNEFMLGFQVPHYEKAKEAVKTSAEKFPGLRYLGWDVAITPNGVEIIEANSSPDNDFHCLGLEHDYYHKLLNIGNK